MLRVQKFFIISLFVGGFMSSGATFCSGQSMDCSTIATSPDSLVAQGASAPYGGASGPYRANLFVHVLRLSDGTGGLSQAQVDAHISQLRADFVGIYIYFHLTGQDYVDNDTWYNNPIDNSTALFSTDSHQDAVDLYLGPNYGTVKSKAKAIPSTAMILTGQADGTAAVSHVLGHCLGLYDTHETVFDPDYPEPAVGDLVSDTPEDPGLLGYVDQNCGLTQAFTDSFPDFSPSTTNIMSASTITCLADFTPEQGNRMITEFELSSEMSEVLTAGDVVYKNVSDDTYLATGLDLLPRNASTINLDGLGLKDMLFSFGQPTNIGLEGQAWLGNPLSGTVPTFSHVSGTWFDLGEKPGSGTTGFIVADYDNDGYEDVYAPNPRGHKLYRNIGGTKFEDVTSDVGLDNISRSSWSHGPCTIGGSWGDYDSDGYVDLLLLMFYEGAPAGDDVQGTGSNTQFLMRNTTGDSGGTYGSFEDVTPASFYEGTNFDRACFIKSALWADFDRDHDLDVVMMQSSSNVGGDTLSEDMANHARYFKNQGDGTFEDISSSLEHSYLWKWRTGTAVAADFNNDGYLDIGFRSKYKLGIFFNDGFGSFPTKYSVEPASKPETWDSCSLDYDLDGRIDLMASMQNSNPIIYANRHDPVLGFSLINESSSAGLAIVRVTYGMCLADFTGDGFTEQYWSRIPTTKDFFFQVDGENSSTQNGWIGICLKSPNGANNRLGLGATVIVHSGSHTQAQVVDGGSGGASQHDHDLVFGLGYPSPGTVNIDVLWPNGHTQSHYLETGIYHEILDSSLDVDDSSVSVEVEFNLGDGTMNWEFTWETKNEGEISEDKVVFDASSLSPACTPSDLVLTPGDADPHSVTQLASGDWEHLLTWRNVACVPKCNIPYSVSSTVNGYTSTSTSDHKVSVPACISGP